MAHTRNGNLGRRICGVAAECLRSEDYEVDAGRIIDCMAGRYHHVDGVLGEQRVGNGAIGMDKSAGTGGHHGEGQLESPALPPAKPALVA